MMHAFLQPKGLAVIEDDSHACGSPQDEGPPF